MATRNAPEVPLGGAEGASHAALQRPWRKRMRLSSFADRCDAFLGRAGFDRGPWLAVAFASGIGLWFWLAAPWQWTACIAGLLLVAAGSAVLWRERKDCANLLMAGLAVGLAMAGGVSTIWARSALVGTEPLERPRVERLEARILEREERPAENRVRLVLAAREAELARAIKVRVNVPMDRDIEGLDEGARIRLRARLMPPAAPILPGAYDFARRAWFDGLAASGSLVGDVKLVAPARGDDVLRPLQRRLSSHVRSRVDGSPGTIAAAFASGDRGAIARPDEDAMRDAGLTHLLSISGLHVSAVMAASYFLALRILALWQWLTLRVRLPILAAGIAAGAGIGYTLLTGAQVPTVRSCVGAVLVLLALALGREPLSLRLVAVAAVVVLLLWPESLVGPSFQMSFAAVIAIIALHGAKPVREFLAPREENWARSAGRRLLVLFLTGVVIEIALTPVVLFHFHRAGLYGAFANVLAIPLVTFVSMPLIAMSLLLDVIGMGGATWWLAGQSLNLLLEIARVTAAQPGAVKLVPQMGTEILLLFVGGGLWLALWQGRARLFGLLPVAIGSCLAAATPAPDILITRDGRHVGIAGAGDSLVLLRDTGSSYARENLLELSGIEGNVLPLAEQPGVRCSRDFCVMAIHRNARSWTIMLARSDALIEERALAAACDQVDIVIADRFLPRSCRPRWLKADRRFLAREGGTALYLDAPRIVTVAQGQGDHGWWKSAAR